MSASSRRKPKAAVRVKARADLLEAVLPEPQVLAALQLQQVVLEVRAEHLVQVPEAQAEHLAVAAVLQRTRSSILPMAKFPTQ